MTYNPGMALSPRQTFNGQRVLRISGQNKKLATWNVRSMFESGKLDNTVKEMERLKIDILGISEVRWPGNNSINHNHGVGVICNENTSKAVLFFLPYSDRIILVKIKTNLGILNIVQVYAPTAEKDD
ncbi:craniofacial development protein 2-like, partial [Centruroides sculpturatus]|uniref:craniofacial development protein 2-like n=1 Tax=Centruroides sculpturatus TaxID=218467 RepID=UPI000C6CA64D